MNVTLNWTPGAGSSTQDVDYKLNAAGTWTSAVTGLLPATTTYTINGLLDNKIYNFRVVTNCVGGTPASSSTISQINIICPAVTTTVTDTSASYSFSPIGGDVTAYTVDLLDTAGTSVLATQTPSVSTPITGTFSGLTASTSYNIRVTATAGTFNKVCPLNSVTTSSTPSCNPPTGVTATLV